MDRRAPVVAVLALLVAAPAAAWTQSGGDAYHAGRSPVAPGPLDIVAISTWDLGADLTGAGIVDAGAHRVGLTSSGGSCSLVRIPEGNASAVVGFADFPCPAGGHLLGASGTTLFVCVPGPIGSGVLQAWSADGTQQWTLDPARQAFDPATLLGGLLPVPLFAFACPGAAIEAATAFVAFTDDRGNHTIEAVSVASGERQWATGVPVSRFAEQDLSVLEPVEPVLEPILGSIGGFVPATVTATDTGIVVTGKLLEGTGLGSPPAAAWMARNGSVQGAVFQQPQGEEVGGSVIVPLSAHPAARNARAATVFGDRLLVVDPAKERAATPPVGQTTFGSEILAAPAWGDAGLVVATETGALLFADDLTDPVRWRGHEGGHVQQIILAGDHAWATVVRETGNGTTADLLRFDARTGTTLQRLPLPITPRDAEARDVRLRPLDDALLVWTPWGERVLIGTRDAPAEGLALDLEETYPAPGAPLIVTPDGPEGARLLLAWGDGTVDEVEAGVRVSHPYDDPGDRVLLLTAIMADGTSSSVSRVVHVGGTEPQEPGLLGILFGPDTWEITVAVIGGTVTAIGILVGVIATYRGRHRLERELKQLDRIRDRGRQEAFEAVQELHEYRDRIRRDMAKGRLQEGQYNVLQQHALDVLDLLRQRILGGFVGLVSDAFSRTLDLALRDGRIDAVEAEALQEAVQQEKLPARDRDRLASLVRSWRQD